MQNYLFMILDTLAHYSKYTFLGPKFARAFDYLLSTDFSQVAKGKYEIDGKDIFAIVNEYDTVDAAGEQMESHKKYIDIQYMVKGEELVGHDFLLHHQPSKAYDPETDFMLFAEKPLFFSVLREGMFAIFFPTDLHMPNIKIDKPTGVRKVVIKVSVDA
ncbi:YhcH/YjgK/YiaL family protein [Chitinophaga sancti]|uniref:YhcH/YjgK/YiaL family protein n=3 Tax=Chitinophaga sancti TaxID=1004 RepID=A0A1K1NGH8_9BACT|nr:YhcH/YjgK/YiaL family protein [Chitinophaga sancti]